jgi:hypothetical protein
VRIPIRSHATSREGIAQTHRPVSEICSQLLRVEALQPFKHSLFFKCTGKADVEALRAVQNTHVTSAALRFKVAAVFDTDAAVVVTFEHSVSVKEWVRQDDENIKRLITIETRHPVVLRVLKASQVASLNYPGFSQGQGTRREELLQYDQVLKGIFDSIAKWGLEPKILSIKESLRVLLKGGNSRVHRFRTDIEAAGVGRFGLASSRRDVSVEESLAELLRISVDPAQRTQFLEATRKALNEADTNSALLYWQTEKVITRLKFWDIGCEILFVWAGEAQSYAIVDQIVELLAGTHDRVDASAVSAGVALQWIAAIDSGKVKQPAQLAEALNLPPGVARSEFVYAVKAGLVQPVYRLRTSEWIPEIENNWTTKLSELSRAFKTDSGHVVDGRDLSNVEVAFQRVGDAPEVGS